MTKILIALSLIIVATLSEAPLDVKVGLTEATTEGFTWTYHVLHPDLGPSGADPNARGKVYWDLSLASDGELTSAEVIAGGHSIGPNCKGQAEQMDEEIHELQMECTLTAGVEYKLWVVGDYDGTGVQTVILQEVIEPQADVDCTGHFEPCADVDDGSGVNCKKSWRVDEWNTGNGELCSLSPFEEVDCQPEDTGYASCQSITVAPTSASPSSADPTTASPTSGAPTTAAPVSTEPTTSLPTTGVPTSAAPTTAVPTLPSGTFSLQLPTTGGFDLTTTFPDTPISGAQQGTYYWVVLNQNDPDPSADQIVSGADPAICGDSAPVTSNGPSPNSLQCTMTPGSNMKVCVALKNTPSATAQKINECQSLQIPSAVPTPELVVHNPITTDRSLIFTYDILNPNPAGMFYYTVTPRDAPFGNGISKEEGIRRASDPSSPLQVWIQIPQGCSGRTQQTSSTLMQTITTTNCIVTQAGNYDLCGETDTDSNGANSVVICVPFTIIDAAIPSQPPVVQPNPGPGPSPPNPPSPPSGAAYADLLFPEAYCESDEEMELENEMQGAGTSQNSQSGETEVELPEEEEEKNALIGSIIYLAPVATAQGCAANVAANRALNLGCSTLFYGGGLLQTCACVRLGYLCDKEESDVHSAIYELTYDPTQDDLYPNGAAVPAGYEPDLKSANPLTSTTVLGLPALYWIAALLGCISVFTCACLCARKQSQDNYHVRLDNGLEYRSAH